MWEREERYASRRIFLFLSGLVFTHLPTLATHGPQVVIPHFICRFSNLARLLASEPLIFVKISVNLYHSADTTSGASAKAHAIMRAGRWPQLADR